MSANHVEDNAIHYVDFLKNPQQKDTLVKLTYLPKSKPSHYYIVDNEITSCNNGEIDLVLIPVAKQTKEHKDFQKIILVNADEWTGNFINLDVKFPGTSLNCLARFYVKDGYKLVTERDTHAVAERLKSGKLKLIDFTYDETMPLRDSDKKTLRNLRVESARNAIKPPQLGFSLTRNIVRGHIWHRSGICLFHDVKLDIYILTGQDEGTYFGVELANPVRTIKEAFADLVPRQAKGKTYQRQGEWFVVPVDEKQVPKKCDCIALGLNDLILPIDHDQANRHGICSFDIRVRQDGQIFAHNVDLQHDEHMGIQNKGWSTFYKNTAKRAFSQEGVD